MRRRRPGSWHLELSSGLGRGQGRPVLTMQSTGETQTLACPGATGPWGPSSLQGVAPPVRLPRGAPESP